MSQRVELHGAEVDVTTWVPAASEAAGAFDLAPVVMLHDGLGSVAQWREVPGDLASRTGRVVHAFDRPGHGGSTPVPSGAWPADWLHREADRLEELLAALGVERVCLVGHSDGGSIAAIHAAERPAGVDALVLLAAHSWVEAVTVERITGLVSIRDRIVDALDPFHDHAGAVFDAWSGAWVGAEFAPWDIRPRLHRVQCPTLVVQGSADEYATEEHAWSTARAVGENASVDLVPGLGHVLHHQAPDRVVDIVGSWIERLPG